jgi:dihydroorotate dehydrogenase electron transfer subunit
MKRQDKTYKIISNKEICSGYFEIKLKIGDISKYCFPGQFFMLSIPGVFLRRPFSIHDIKGGIVSFLYKIVGKGAKILSTIKKGEINLLGPLGKGYELNCNILERNCHSKVVLESAKTHRFERRGEYAVNSFNPAVVAGGTGIASVYFLASKLKTKGTLYYGAESKKDLLCLNKFKKLGWKIVISTVDGSQGQRGFITDIVEKKVKSDDILYVCGPSPMTKKILTIAKEKSISGFVSLEEKMACGVGNCQGCAVKIDGQIKMTCKDGPVFKIEEVEL